MRYTFHVKLFMLSLVAELKAFELLLASCLLNSRLYEVTRIFFSLEKFLNERRDFPKTLVIVLEKLEIDR